MIKVKRTITSITFLFFFYGLSSQLLLQINKDTTLIWYYSEGDEFNQQEINTAYWSYHFGWGRSIYPNKEQQYYTDGENHILQNGDLALFAEKKKVNKKIIDWKNESDSIIEKGINYGINKREFDYTSGMLQSNKSFKYGYFEIKFQMPANAGFWPAFWLYGCSPNEEIDMMELKTEISDKLHIGRFSQNPKENFTRKGPFKRAWGEWIKLNGNLTSGYHIVAGEWTKEHLKYYLNGELIAYSPISMNCPKYLVTNIAVPSNNGPFKPGPVDTTKRSGNFKIDYIRIWSAEDTLKKESGIYKETDTTKKIQLTRMRNTGRATYGPKKLHKKQGISVSVFPSQNGYEICVLGKSLPETDFELIDENGKTFHTQKLSYGITALNVPHDNPTFLKFKIYKRTHKLVLNQGRISQE